MGSLGGRAGRCGAGAGHLACGDDYQHLSPAPQSVPRGWCPEIGHDGSTDTVEIDTWYKAEWFPGC